MINDLWHGYDVSSTLTSNFSADFDFLSPTFQGNPPLEHGFRESSFPRKTRLVSSVPPYSVPRFLLWLSFPAPRPDAKGIEAKKGGMSPPDRYASSVRDVIRVSLPSIASDRFPTSTGESLVLHCDYIVSHGVAKFKFFESIVARTKIHVFLLVWKNFIVLDWNLNSSIMIDICTDVS